MNTDTNRRYSHEEWKKLKELLNAGFTFEHIAKNYITNRTVQSLQALSRIDESYFCPDAKKATGGVTVEFTSERIEELIAAEIKPNNILDAIYSSAKASENFDDVMFFPSGMINGILKRTDGVRYWDELERLNNEQ